jgi:hypothetical protein
MTKSLVLLLAVFLAVSPRLEAEDLMGWQNDCSSTKDWFDNASDPSFMAKIEQAEPSVFKVTQTGPQTWGKVACVVKEVDLDNTPVLQVKVNKVDLNSAYKIGVASLDWKEFYEIVPRSSADGLRVANIKSATGWSGLKDFNIVVIVEGKGKSAYLDELKIVAKKSARETKYSGAGEIKSGS